MDWQIDLIYVFFLGASINLTWILAKRQGVSQTLDFLRERGDIDFED